MALDLGSLPRLVTELLASVTAPVWEYAPCPCPQGHKGLLEGKGGGGQTGCLHAPGLLCTKERQVGKPVELGHEVYAHSLSRGLGINSSRHQG